MKQLFLILALALTALTVTSVSGAAGASTLHFSFKGQFAEADFDSVDPSGCVETFVFVEGVNGTVKEAGKPAASSMAFIAIDQFDFCTSARRPAHDSGSMLGRNASRIHVGYDVECLPALLVRWEPDAAALSATRDQGNVLGFHAVSLSRSWEAS